MHEVNQEEPSEEWKCAWRAAGSHIQSKCREGLNWLRSDLNPPMAEHLSFRIGNQLFFVFVEAAEFSFEYGKELFLGVADDAGAVPCLIKMRINIADFEPVENGWGLVDARSNLFVDPLLLVSDELIEMTDWELHDFSIQVVKQYLIDEGKNIFSAQSSQKIDPSIWYEENGSSYWVVVRASRHPAKEALQPENIAAISQSFSNKGAAGYFASVVVANTDDPFDPDAERNKNFLPLYRGHSMTVKFNGLQKL